MYKNYFKLAIKVLMRRKMFTFISLFGICFTLTILLCATSLYTYKVVSNPIENKLSRTLYVSYVLFTDEKNHSMNCGPVMPYFLEAALRPLHNVETISFCSTQPETVTTYIGSDRIDIDAKQTDENFFKIMTFQFLEGRSYTKEEIEAGNKVAVICASLRKRLFSDEVALGKTIILNNENYRVIGVVKDIPKLFQTPYAQFWKPYNYATHMNEAKNKKYGSWAYKVIVLANKPSDFDAIRSEFKQKYSWLKPMEHFTKISSLMETSFYHNFGKAIFNSNWSNPDKYEKDKLIQKIIIISSLLLFLLIPLLNLTNLTVSRIFERASEIGVRKAFGATKKQMIGQFVFENIIITILGGILGFGGAFLLLKGIDSSGIMEIGSVGLSFRIVFYGFLVIVLFGIISGFYPALKMSKLQIIDTMKGGNK